MHIKILIKHNISGDSTENNGFLSLKPRICTDSALLSSGNITAQIWGDLKHNSPTLACDILRQFIVKGNE